MKWHAQTAPFLLFILIQVHKQMKIAACGELQSVLRSRIENGYDALRWPWHVAIYHQLEDDLMYECGGTIISSKLILTAAHCVMVSPEVVSVSLGRLQLSSSPSSAPFIKVLFSVSPLQKCFDTLEDPIMQVAEILRHPNYKAGNKENDIAIVALATDAIFDDNVQPICMWKKEEMELSTVIGRSGTVVGWGLTEKGETSNVLQEASLPVVPSLMCLSTNRDLFGRFLTDGNFCAGAQNGTGVCTGDSGGSLTFQDKADGKYYIRGIVSVGASRLNRATNEVVCDSMQFALFTDVAKYLPWITETIGCETHFTCDFEEDDTFCSISLPEEESESKCKIIFDATSNVPVTALRVYGAGSRVLPDVSSAIDTFVNLETLSLVGFVVVKRAEMSPFRKISTLFFETYDSPEFDGDIFFDLTNLTHLNLFQNGLKVLHSDTFKELHKLKKLSIAHTDLTTLPSGIFDQLINVEELTLIQNYIETLPANVFLHNTKMMVLYFTSNPLKVVHENLFFGLTNLEDLNLSLNRIEYLPSGLFRNNARLKIVDLSYNKINRIEINVRTMPQLLSLDLTKNTCISEGFHFAKQSLREASKKIRKSCGN